ncbi:putative PKS/NRPS-like protein biosynthetic cluster [Steccherinum ochraceum]|uniref:Putative PKS/NRPS-like protein biosynthetic cluster n=1 Tax=Steccherinum ochraceum TaxID=92696 RepID=A0A4R0RD11_9APHY|nr:putative PKS/NRPS-like protein biosynthetic cluster [Steccherinum ochraceum]
MGIFMQLYAPLVSGQYVGLYAPQWPAPPVVPNPQNIIDSSKATECDGVMVVPSIVEVWAQSPEIVDYLATFKILTFAGGPLSDMNGDKLTCAGVKLCAIYGGTEFGSPTGANDEKTDDWAWFKFAEFVKPRWIPQGDGTHELHFLTCDTHHPAIENLPDVRGYNTSDLFIPHPTKPDLWKIVGRSDDVIVLGSGEKIVPLPQEGYLASLPFVQGAVMFGRGQTQAGVLIEPRPDFAIDPNDEEALTAFRNKIWPSIEEANKLAPSFARIFKEMILVTDPARPMQRAAKGTAMRKLVLTSYIKEIDQLYETIEASTSANGVEPPSVWNTEAVEEWLVKHTTTINKGREPSVTVDIFDQGFDSLSATFLRNRIIGALRSSSDSAAQQAASRVPQEFVFTNPTLQKLAVAVVQLIHPERALNGHVSGPAQIMDFVERYSADLPTPKVRADGAVVLLTGSTGNLGSHILAALLQSSDVKAVYTLDRGIASEQRLKASFFDRGLSVDLLQSDRLTTCSGDLSQTDLGLNAQVLEEIRHSVTHIVHNAWKLDFNLSITSFQSHIANTRNIINFSAACSRPVKLLFSSSIAAAQRWDAAKGPVPEDVLSDPNLAVGSGYGESKYVVERILERAKQNGLDTMTFRIGQLSGSTGAGAWNVSDWVPILIKSSIALSYLPQLNGLVDWTPIDIAANTIVDIIQSSAFLPNLINITHPRPIPWSDVFAAVNVSVGGRLQSVPFSDWLTKLEARSANATEQDFNDVPAIKLVRFFRSISMSSAARPDAPNAGGRALYENTRAQALSESLRSAQPIDQAGVGLWLKYWESRDPNFLKAG